MKCSTAAGEIQDFWLLNHWQESFREFQMAPVIQEASGPWREYNLQPSQDRRAVHTYE